MLNSPPILFFYEAYIKHFALSDQFGLLVFSHVLQFLSINLFAVFLIIILTINVLKKALNNFRGHITAKKCLRRPKVVTFYLSCTLVYSGQCRWAQSPWLHYWLEVWF